MVSKISGVALLVTLLAIALGAQTPSSSSGAEGQRVLNKAKQWLGGPAALVKVQALEIARENGALRLLLPDRYQLETKTSYEPMVVSFDGAHLWTKTPKELPAIPDSPLTAEVKTRGLRNAALYSLTYLLRTVPTYDFGAPRVVGSKECANVSSICLEFTPRAGSSIALAFNQADGRPLAIVQKLSDPAGFGISDLSDYREVDGIKLPATVAERRIDTGTGKVQTLSTWRAIGFRINPKLTKADFEKR
jgi:hypothetical protein